MVPLAEPRLLADGGRVSFAPEAYLDQARAVGFHAEGHTYCAAPVSSRADPTAAVNFWAVGRDCCGLRGSFECDAAPKQTGRARL